ncbi:hypothetical protein TrLO_g7558 [Triparma laevis f. longispina]|uniref:Uncharacterized protein n=1 Tax=Triparma laevis f. longispina TaxID=1714387 RepID=A0A9W7A5K2_9STRA|nr:hypothetical protein TrLO_g7558 [Triparma laevis f. longispina]
MKEKLFIVLCALTTPAYCFIQAHLTGSELGSWMIMGCSFALLLVPSYLASAKLYSKFEDPKLGAAITTIFKALPGLLGSLLYISSASIQCIMNYSSEDKMFEGYWDYHKKRCQNPSWPTVWVSVFLMTSWWLTHLLPPMLPSNRALTWNGVVKRSMNRVEGLHFTLFCTFSMEALMVYSLTDNEGGGTNDFLDCLIDIMFWSLFALIDIVVYEHLLKPLVCQPSSRTAASSVTTRPDDSFDIYSNGLNINSL